MNIVENELPSFCGSSMIYDQRPAIWAGESGPAHDVGLRGRLQSINPFQKDAPTLPDPGKRPSKSQRRYGTKKLSNAQRARHAANQRHQKAKTTISDDQKIQEAAVRQREANRIAAAKCRSKKKVERDEIEQLARNLALANERLARDVQTLQTQRTLLHTLMITHNPNTCSCSAIHDINAQGPQVFEHLVTDQLDGFDGSVSQKATQPVYDMLETNTYVPLEWNDLPKHTMDENSTPLLPDVFVERHGE